MARVPHCVLLASAEAGFEAVCVTAPAVMVNVHVPVSVVMLLTNAATSASAFEGFHAEYVTTTLAAVVDAVGLAGVLEPEVDPVAETADDAESELAARELDAAAGVLEPDDDAIAVGVVEAA